MFQLSLETQQGISLEVQWTAKLPLQEVWVPSRAGNEESHTLHLVLNKKLRQQQKVVTNPG